MSLNPPDLRQDARPMTHIELLDLDRLPEHLLVIGKCRRPTTTGIT